MINKPIADESCALCEINETGHGIIMFNGIGWMSAIKREAEGYFMVINHSGAQTDFMINYCPRCGAELSGRKEAYSGTGEKASPADVDDRGTGKARHDAP